MNKHSFYLILLVLGTACHSNGKRMQVSEELPKDMITVTDSINKIKTDSLMNEKYDYESTNGGEQDIYIERNGWIIAMNSMTESGTFYDMYPSPPAFYMTQKKFYINGNIKSEETTLGDRVLIDTSKYYNEDGYMVEEVNENKKFGKVKPEHILKFLEKEGWINLKTGEGGYFVSVKDTQFSVVDEKCIFELDFEPIGESYYIKDNKIPIWVITIPARSRTNHNETLYLIDGETGQVLKKETKKVLRDE